MVTLSVTAFPNPFKDKVNFVITSSISGDATLEVFDNVGRKLLAPYKGHITAGKNQVIEYKAPLSGSSTLIYKLRIGDKIVTGKLININQ